MSDTRSSQRSKYFWKIDRWEGGLSDDSRIGKPGSFRYGHNLDYRSDSGLLQVNQKPELISPTEGSHAVNVEIKWIDVHPTNGEIYYYGTNKIFKEATNGTITLVHEPTGAGQGMADFNGHLYYARDTVIGRFNYTATWTDSFQTGLVSAPWMPMCRFKNLLLVGHGRYIATFDDIGTFTLQALRLPPGMVARSIFRAGSYAVILATRNSDVAASDEGYMFLWNGISPQYNELVPINGIPHAGISLNNKLVMIANNQPIIMESYGGPAETMENVALFSPGQIGEIYPGAIDIWRNMVWFGMAGSSSECIKGVYSYGAKNRYFLDTLNADFIPSHGVVSGANVRITALKRIGNTIRFAWKNGDSYGIDKVNVTGYAPEAVYRSLAFDNTSPHQKTPVKLVAEIAGKLRADESLTAKISPHPYTDPAFADSASIATATLTTVGEDRLELPLNTLDNQIRSRDLHLELRLAGTGATRPAVKRVWVEVDEDPDIL